MNESIYSNESNEKNNGNILKQNLQTFLQPPVTSNQQSEQLNEVLQQTDIQKAIFFDNDKKKIEQVRKACGNIITLVEVQETSSSGPFEYFGTKWMNHLRNRLADKTYFDYLASLGQTDTLDKFSGIQKRHLDALEEWIKTTADYPRRAAIFDWDRTLTMFEGFSLNFYEGLSYEPVLRYLLGGDVRYQALLSMFQTLHALNIQIIILTNNGACGSPDNEDYRLFFQEMSKELLYTIPFTLICSRYTANGHKGVAIRQDPRFTGCVAQQSLAQVLPKGGKRKTKSKSKTKGKRKSKRKTRNC
jgi:hypothetical protein